MPITQFVTNPPATARVEIPEEGFPFAEQELRGWFQRKYGREASVLEISAIMTAMIARDSNRAPRSRELWGWRVEPGADPEVPQPRE
jgi:hypothetical protein